MEEQTPPPTPRGTRSRLTPRAAALAILGTLRDAGHEALLAGGCVRDALLGLEPADYDIATDAPPGRVLELFPHGRGVGAAFGVVLVRRGGVEVEVATFRQDAAYTDGRRPDAVTFSDARHDALRRDFTINGLFADPLAPPDDATTPPALGRVIDYVGGVADLDTGIIRAIGDGDARLGEDYLRMLRAVRFASRFGFQLDPATAAAIRRHAPRLADISRERIGQEVQRMLMQPAAQPRSTTSASPVIATRPGAWAAMLLQELGLDAPALDEATCDRTPAALSRLGPAASYPAVLAAWAVDRHAMGATLPAAAAFATRQARAVIQRWRAALCLSNETCDALRNTLVLLPRIQAWPTLGIAARKRLLADPHGDQAWHVLRALHAEEVAAAVDADAAQLRHGQGVAPPPLIDGSDLIAAGLKPGPAFARLLRLAYDAQLEHRVTTPAQALALVLDAR